MSGEYEDRMIRRGNFEGYHRGDEIDLSFRQQSDMARLRGVQAGRNEDYRNGLLEQQKQLEANLQLEGWRKAIRDRTGRTERDQQALENVQKSIEDMEMREQQERETLERRHADEEARRQQIENDRRAYMEREMAEERKAQQPEREQMQEVFSEAAAEDERLDSSRQTPAIEQDNTAPIAPDFNDAARQEYIRQEMQAEPSQEFGEVSREAEPQQQRSH